MAMEVRMISSLPKPKTKHDLLRRLSRIRIHQIEVIEPYDPSMADQITKTTKTIMAKPGQVSIIILRIP